MRRILKFDQMVAKVRPRVQLLKSSRVHHAQFRSAHPDTAVGNGGAIEIDGSLLVHEQGQNQLNILLTYGVRVACYELLDLHSIV